MLTLSGPDKRTNSQGTFSWPDHISDRALEQMGLAIIEGNECEQVLQHYRIIVWVKAMGCISKLAPLIPSEPLKIHFRKLKKRYEAAATELLNQVPLAAAPSLLLLQSLMSAVCLFSVISHYKNLTDVCMADTLDAIFRKHVTLLDVHRASFEGDCFPELSQHYGRPTPK
jgi:hypothetical protein